MSRFKLPLLLKTFKKHTHILKTGNNTSEITGTPGKEYLTFSYALDT